MLTFVVLLAAAGCGGGDAPGGAAGPGPGGGMPPMPVEMVTLSDAPVDRTGEFVGVVKSRRSTTIQPQAEGIVREILVRSGARVARGTPLFAIDAAEQEAAVASLESARVAREADAAFARQQAERARTLLEVGAMSQQEYEQAVTLQQTAEAQLRAAEQQVQQQRVQLGYYRVEAPTTGVVGDIPVRVGDRVTKSTVLTTVDDNSGFEVYINVPVEQAGSLAPGLPVRIVDAAGTVLRTERINFVSPSVDETTQTVLVKAPLDGGGGQFRTEQFVRAQVVFSTSPGLTVPVVSVNRINGQFFAFVAEPGEGGGLVARQRALTLGPIVGNGYVVLSGLETGDRLITAGIQKIGDGAPVMDAAAAGAAGAPPGAAGGSGGGQ